MNADIKVVHYLGGFKFGGIERLVYDLTEAQKKNRKLTLSILVLSDGGEFADDFRKLNVPIYAVNPKSTYQFKIEQFRVIKKALKSCDIFHLHGFHPIIAIIGIIYRKKLVYTEHGNFAFGRELTWKDKISQKLRVLFFKWFADSVIANSNFTKNVIYERWGVFKRVKVIHNGSNIKKIPNLETVRSIQSSVYNQFIVGTISRLAEVKRIDRLIDSFKIFAANKKDIILMIVGDGPEMENLKQRVNTAGLETKVSFVGFKSNAIDYQSAFDICVVPSNFESFGLVAVELYNIQKPALAFSDGGGLTEIISKCDSKDIVSSIEEMAERIDYYYRNRGILKDTKDLMSFFSTQRMESDYFKTYKSLLCVE